MTPGRLPSRFASGARALPGALLFVVAVLALDLLRAMGRPHVHADAGAIAVYLAAGFALGGTLALCLSYAGALGWQLARRGAAHAAGVGALAGALTYGVAIGLQDPASIQGATRAWLLAVAAASGAGALLCATRWPRLAPVLCLSALALSVYWQVNTAWWRWTWFRLATDGIALLGCAGLLSRHVPLRVGVLGCGLVALAIPLGELGMRRSEGGRRLLHHESSHALSWSLALVQLADGDGDWAFGLLGGRDCDPDDAAVFPGATQGPGSRGRNCDVEHEGRARHSTATAPARPPPARAPGELPDVLLLSVDGLRWDAVHELVRTRAALPDAVIFRRAVSPAPRTMHSLGATLRGRALRQIQLSAGALASLESPHDDPSPTLGSLLAEGGYRAVAAPTHRYLNQASGLLMGLEELGGDALDKLPELRHGMGRGDVAVEAILQGTRDEPRPVLAWVHFMETHHPYFRDREHYGPTESSSYRAAVRQVDGLLAQALLRFRRARARPLIVAIFGDHGEAFFEHGRNLHSFSVYAEQVRVGLLLSAPGLLPRGSIDAPVSIAALPATLLELVGLSRPASLTHGSLVSCVRQRRDCPGVAVSELHHMHRTRTGYTFARHRLIQDPLHRTEELYATETDPYEQHDLAAERPELLRELRARARRWDAEN